MLCSGRFILVESVCQLIKNSRLQSFLGQEAAILNLSKCSKQFSPIFYSIFSNFPILFSPIFLFNFLRFFFSIFSDFLTFSGCQQQWPDRPKRRFVLSVQIQPEYHHQSQCFWLRYQIQDFETSWPGNHPER